VGSARGENEAKVRVLLKRVDQECDGPWACDEPCLEIRHDCAVVRKTIRNAFLSWPRTRPSTNYLHENWQKFVRDFACFAAVVKMKK